MVDQLGIKNKNMENKKFKYDAFISYRHTELDKFVAENEKDDSDECSMWITWNCLWYI